MSNQNEAELLCGSCFYCGEYCHADPEALVNNCIDYINQEAVNNFKELLKKGEKDEREN